MLTHTGEKPFACGQCDYRCCDKRSLRRHIGKRHPDTLIATLPVPATIDATAVLEAIEADVATGRQVTAPMMVDVVEPNTVTDTIMVPTPQNIDTVLLEADSMTDAETSHQVNSAVLALDAALEANVRAREAQQLEAAASILGTDTMLVDSLHPVTADVVAAAVAATLQPVVPIPTPVAVPVPGPVAVPVPAPAPVTEA
jgi:hypothetical protein